MPRCTPYGHAAGPDQAEADCPRPAATDNRARGRLSARLAEEGRRQPRRSPIVGGGAYGERVVHDEVLDTVLDASPGDRARSAADALGDAELTAWCRDLIAGRVAWGDPAGPDIGWVGGRAARGWGSPERLDDTTDYWARVWAARTLLYVWDDACTAEIVAGLSDPAWRVREMCAKVGARWEVGPVADACAVLVDDEIPRVRAAAIRVLGVTGEAEHADAVRRALDDADASVSAAAERALRTLQRRLDRPL